MTEIYNKEIQGLCKDCGMNACKSWDYAKKDKEGNVIECCIYYPHSDIIHQNILIKLENAFQ